MSIFFNIIMLCVSIFLIVKGGDLFVESSVWIARIAHISEMIIGATIVSIGTTLPEFCTSLFAAIKGTAGDVGYSDIALSNAIGSMLANSGLILSIVLLFRPPKFDERNFTKSGIYVLLISILLVIFVCTGSRITHIEGIVLLLLFIIFMVLNIESARCETSIHFEDCAKGESKVKMIAFFIVGAVGISVGAMLLVDNAKALASAIGISEQLVGVTVVAVGTSLPELVTSLTSLRHHSEDIGVGNILGAHIINSTLIVGIVAVVTRSAFEVDEITRNVTVWVMLLVMLILIIPTIIRRKFSRVQGGIMLAIYLGYVITNVCKQTY